MKFILSILLCTILSISVYAQKKKSQATKTQGIEWMSLDDVQEQMMLIPKMVYINIYTDDCGWCKEMDKKTLANKQVVDFINKNFYAVKLNAEGADSLTFKGKKYGRVSNSKMNALVAEWMNNKVNYPTAMFFDENFKNPRPLPGYLDIQSIELILKYLATNHEKSVPFEKFKNGFRGTW